MSAETFQFWYRRAQQHRFVVLLASLVLLAMLYPAVEGRYAGKVLLHLLLSLTLLAGVFAASPHRHVTKVSMGLFAAAFFANTWAAYFDGGAPNTVLQTASAAVTLAAFAMTASVILSDVVKLEPINADKIAGAISVYLMIGVCWGFVYMLIYVSNPEAFRFAELEARLDPGEAEQLPGFSQLMYYSFVTLTTLGYGDIIPTTPQTRTLAWMEAVFGQLYLAILIARLVGLSARPPAPGDCESDP